MGNRDLDNGGDRCRFRDFDRDGRIVAQERAVDVADYDGAATAISALLENVAATSSAAARTVNARSRGEGPAGAMAAVLPARCHRVGGDSCAAASARTVDDRLASDGACISRSARAWTFC